MPAGRPVGSISKVGKRDFTSEEIMAKAPETIDKASIPIKPIGGGHRHKKPRSRQLSGKRPIYSEEIHIKAACVYAMVGSAAETARIIGVKPEVIRQWKMQPWWNQVIDRIRSEHDDKLDVKLTTIIDKSVDVINERLENGDYVYDAKNGELIRKPMGGKETAVVTSIMVDKRALLREKRSHRTTEETAVIDRLKKLAAEFEGFVKAKDVTRESMNATEQDTEQAAPSTDGSENPEVLNEETPSITDVVLSEILDSGVPGRDHGFDDDTDDDDDTDESVGNESSSIKDA